MTPRKPRVHICGIGGTAMVAGARLAIEAGWEVRGSDNPLYPPTSEMVASLVVPVADGYDARNLDWDPDVVLIGNVLSRGNPEVEAVLERRLRYASLPEWLKEHVLRTRIPVVVCGTHGKTTTTALTAHILRECGLDPGHFIGGQPVGDIRSARLCPEGAPFVIEGDEYDTAFFDKRAKFFHYLPEIAVVTSLEFDHGDIYGSLVEIKVAFQRMLRQISRTGWLIACADNAAAGLVAHAHSQTLTYGFSENAQWRGEIVPGSSECATLRIYCEGVEWAVAHPSIWGMHNFQNILAGVAVAGVLGCSPDRVAQAVAHFPGVKRRMEVFHECGGVTFVDDFAHHPTAIRETIAAARMRWPGRRLRVLFEPRSNTTVTNQFQDDLEEAFSNADEVWLGPLHRAEAIPEEMRLDRARLCSFLREHGKISGFEDNVPAMAHRVLLDAAAGDVILILSNGAFGGIYGLFREALP